VSQGSKPIDRDRRHYLARLSVAIAGAGLGLYAISQVFDCTSRDVSGLDRAGEWTVSNLAGRVVVVDFCTYTCINWLRTLPRARTCSPASAESLPAGCPARRGRNACRSARLARVQSAQFAAALGASLGSSCPCMIAAGFVAPQPIAGYADPMSRECDERAASATGLPTQFAPAVRSTPAVGGSETARLTIEPRRQGIASRV
jgi:hypothetical protein